MAKKINKPIDNTEDAVILPPDTPLDKRGEQYLKDAGKIEDYPSEEQEEEVEEQEKRAKENN